MKQNTHYPIRCYPTRTFLHMFLAKLSVLLIKLRYIFPLAAPFFRHISTFLIHTVKEISSWPTSTKQLVIKVTSLISKPVLYSRPQGGSSGKTGFRWYRQNIDKEIRVHIILGGHQLFDWQCIGQINGGDGLLRIYEL